MNGRERCEDLDLLSILFVRFVQDPHGDVVVRVAVVARHGRCLLQRVAPGHQLVPHHVAFRSSLHIPA
ncbi:MAG: hypothetical protein ACK559_03220 [bacterium]